MSERGALRILMVSDFYPPYVGGMERAVADLSGALAARGHAVAVATLWRPGLARHEYDGAVDIHRLTGAAQRMPFLYARPDRPFHPPIADPLLCHHLRELIERHKPDIVHGHSWMMSSVLPLQRRFGFATVVTLHDYGLVCPKKTLLHRNERVCPFQVGVRCVSCARRHYGFTKAVLTTVALRVGRRAYRAVDFLIATSSYVAQIHANNPAIGSRVVTIPNLVSDTVLQASPGLPLSGLPNEYVLFVGVLGRHKGLHVLLEAYRRAGTTVPLVLIGPRTSDTPTRFPEGVVVRPALSQVEVLRAMDHAHFLVNPSILPETFGLVVTEAMARRRAVVASGVGGIVDIVQDGTTGVLVPPGDATALAAAMRALLEDPVRAARMGRAARARCADHFSARVLVERFENLYRQARLRRLNVPA